MNSFKPGKDEHFASFVCRWLLLQGEGWTNNDYANCFQPNSNGAPRFLPAHDIYQRYAELIGKTDAQFFDDHTLFLLLVIYYQQRADLPPAPEDTSAPPSLHFCPECMIDAVKHNGWAFIKRSWTVPNVRACVKHKKKLVDISTVYCRCHSLNSGQWFEDLLLGVCSSCKGYLWAAEQEEAGNLDLESARIFQSLCDSNYVEYKFEENRGTLRASYVPGNDDYMFGFRLKNVSYVLERLQALNFFPYSQISQNTKGLTDLEDVLVSGMENEMFRKHGDDWLEMEEIDAMVIGDEPTDYEMALDFESTRFALEQPVIVDQDLAAQHNKYITNAYSNYFELWSDKHGEIKAELLRKFCFEALACVDPINLCIPLKNRLELEEAIENTDYRLGKIIEKYFESQKK